MSNACPVCTFFNEEEELRCSMCGSELSSSLAFTAAAAVAVADEGVDDYARTGKSSSHTKTAQLRQPAFGPQLRSSSQNETIFKKVSAERTQRVVDLLQQKYASKALTKAEAILAKKSSSECIVSNLAPHVTKEILLEWFCGQAKDPNRMLKGVLLMHGLQNEPLVTSILAINAHSDSVHEGNSAIVRFYSKEVLDKIYHGISQAATGRGTVLINIIDPAIVLEGKQLAFSLRVPNGSFKNRRHTTNCTTIRASELQLGMPGPFEVQWHSAKGRSAHTGGGVKVEINREDKRSVRITTRMPSKAERQRRAAGGGVWLGGEGGDEEEERRTPAALDSIQLEIDMRLIREMNPKREISPEGTDIFVLNFRILAPPRLFRPSSKATESIVGEREVASDYSEYYFDDTYDEEEAMSRAIRNSMVVVSSSSRDEEYRGRWQRSVDPTGDLSIFGRNLVYRLVFGNLDELSFRDFLSSLHDFALVETYVLRNSITYIDEPIRFLSEDEPADTRNDKFLHELLWHDFESSGVPYRTRYMLHCLHSISKIDLVTAIRWHVELFAALCTSLDPSYAKIDKAMEILYSDPTCLYVPFEELGGKVAALVSDLDITSPEEDGVEEAAVAAAEAAVTAAAATATAAAEEHEKESHVAEEEVAARDETKESRGDVEQIETTHGSGGVGGGGGRTTEDPLQKQILSVESQLSELRALIASKEAEEGEFLKRSRDVAKDTALRQEKAQLSLELCKLKDDIYFLDADLHELYKEEVARREAGQLLSDLTEVESEIFTSLPLLDVSNEWYEKQARIRSEWLAWGSMTHEERQKASDDAVRKLNKEKISVQRVIITPLRICPKPLETDESNRVLREFARGGSTHRFIRVVFVDENLDRLGSHAESLYEERVRRIMHGGFNIAGRYFVFLAFSNSQAKQASCWFYDQDTPCDASESETPGVRPPSADDIRAWVGDMSHIRIVGKYASRLGQGFSNTKNVAQIDFEDVAEISDVINNGHTFSDGVGMINEVLAEKIAIKLGLASVPSSFQIRFGGGKGVLSVRPKCVAMSKQISIRPSMKKFTSLHSSLEVCDYSKRLPCYLNRQLINVLVSRGVPPEHIWNLFNDMKKHFDEAMSCNEAALRFLMTHAYIGKHEKNTSMAPFAAPWHLLSNGFRVQDDVYISGLLLALRNSELLAVKRKARIRVPNGVVLMGIMDETGSLRPNQIFVQISSEKAKAWGQEEGTADFGGSGGGVSPFTESVTNLADIAPDKVLLVGRSPALHPGDVQMFFAAHNERLKDLVDVVVFPQTGTRSIPSMLSGGDLDGDIYFVVWDKNLRVKNRCVPMDYRPPEESPVVKPPGEVITGGDIADFLVDFLKDNNLGEIAMAHMDWADMKMHDEDKSRRGVLSTQCLELANLHSTAVDFMKTGIKAQMPFELQTSQSPDYQEKKNKAMYKSETVLGRIYRECKNVRVLSRSLPAAVVAEELAGLAADGGEGFKHDAELLLGEEYLAPPPFCVDPRMLLTGIEEFELMAQTLLIEYNHRLWRIMEHFDINDEMEAVSGKWTSKDKPGKDHFDDEIKLRDQVTALRKQFREYFFADLSPLTAPTPLASSIEKAETELRAVKKASAWYKVTYSQKCTANGLVPFCSFCYCVYDVLCKLKRFVDMCDGV